VKEYTTEQLWGLMKKAEFKSATEKWVRSERIEGSFFHLFTFDQLRGSIGDGDAMRWQAMVQSEFLYSLEGVTCD